MFTTNLANLTGAPPCRNSLRSSWGGFLRDDLPSSRLLRVPMGTTNMTLSGWWLTYPSEKYESQLEFGIIIPNICKKIKMFQTTNQLLFFFVNIYIYITITSPSEHVQITATRWPSMTSRHHIPITFHGSCPCLNGHDSGTDWLEVPTIYIYTHKAYVLCKGYSHWLS